MAQFSIGVIADSFQAGVRAGVKKAAQLGAQGIQVYSVSGEMAPENMSGAVRREFLNFVKSHGLVISALCGDLGSGGFINAERNVEKIERSKRILELAKELETDIVTTHIGVVPDDPQHDRYKVMQEACFALSQYADELDAHFAIETGPEKADTLRGFLDSLGSTGVAVNLDPANLVMVTGDDPVQAVYTLKDYIVHTHAKDGKQLYYQAPEIVYGIERDVTGLGESFLEVPLGEGNVNFPAYLRALDEIGYRGFLTIEREVGDDPAADVAKAVVFLQQQIAAL